MTWICIVLQSRTWTSCKKGSSSISPKTWFSSLNPTQYSSNASLLEIKRGFMITTRNTNIRWTSGERPISHDRKNHVVFNRKRRRFRSHQNSPALAPYDFLFDTLKSYYGERVLATESKYYKNRRQFLPKIEYYKCFENWIKRWHTCNKQVFDLCIIKMRRFLYWLHSCCCCDFIWLSCRCVNKISFFLLEYLSFWHCYFENYTTTRLKQQTIEYVIEVEIC